jgi:hypothetical protein
MPPTRKIRIAVEGETSIGKHRFFGDLTVIMCKCKGMFATLSSGSWVCKDCNIYHRWVNGVADYSSLNKQDQTILALQN